MGFMLYNVYINDDPGIELDLIRAWAFIRNFTVL